MYDTPVTKLAIALMSCQATAAFPDTPGASPDTTEASPDTPEASPDTTATKR